MIRRLAVRSLEAVLYVIGGLGEALNQASDCLCEEIESSLAKERKKEREHERRVKMATSVVRDIESL